MTIKIYDYANNVKVIDLPDKRISAISVSILSGDETGTIIFADGEIVKFDASDGRMMNYYDGSYLLTDENIEKWINFTPSDGRTVSYERQEVFDPY